MSIVIIVNSYACCCTINNDGNKQNVYAKSDVETLYIYSPSELIGFLFPKFPKAEITSKAVFFLIF